MTKHKKGMTELEMLSMAGQALGYTLHIWGSKGSENVARMDVDPPANWNPSKDDGDCARMEADLGIDLTWRGDHVQAALFFPDGSDLVRVEEQYAKHGSDRALARHSARRTASLRAVAEFHVAMQAAA